MKQLTYIKANTLRWEDVPEPRITSENEAIVRPFLVARCDLASTQKLNYILEGDKV